jgi:branched-chain amino acid aminotransferase
MNKMVADYVWFDGQLIKVEEAKVSILTHALHFGTSVFEGIRGHHGKNNLYIFRLREHMQRLLNSADVYSINVKYDINQLIDAAVSLCRENNVKESCYIRPLAFVGINMAINVTKESPSHLGILIFFFDKFFTSNEIKVCVSSWRRIHDSSTPPLAKAAGNYLNSLLAIQECKRNGFDEAIILDGNGMVSEAPSENIFIVRNKEIATPSISSSVLEGITRDTIIRIAKDMGYSVVERVIPRTELYMSDEIFLTGSAADITPVVNVDGHIIGDGKEGSVTKSIREMYSKIVRAEVEEYMHWLTPVY